MLRIIRQQPVFEALIHHRRFDFEMQSRCAAVFQRPGIQFAFDCRGVIDNLQTRAARELAEISWTLRTWRMMQKFRRITFNNSIDIVDAELMLIDQQSIGRRLAFKNRDRPLDTKNPANERANQKRNDAEMGDEKRGVIFLPGPARERGRGQIRAEQNEPGIEPRRAIDVSARYFGVETRFVECTDNRTRDEHSQQHDGKLERREKLEDRVLLPRGLVGSICFGHSKIDIFREETHPFNCYKRPLQFGPQRPEMFGERGHVEIVMSLDV